MLKRPEPHFKNAFQCTFANQLESQNKIFNVTHLYGAGLWCLSLWGVALETVYPGPCSWLQQKKITALPNYQSRVMSLPSNEKSRKEGGPGPSNKALLQGASKGFLFLLLASNLEASFVSSYFFWGKIILGLQPAAVVRGRLQLHHQLAIDHGHLRQFRGTGWPWTPCIMDVCWFGLVPDWFFLRGFLYYRQVHFEQIGNCKHPLWRQTGSGTDIFLQSNVVVEAPPCMSFSIGSRKLIRLRQNSYCLLDNHIGQVEISWNDPTMASPSSCSLQATMDGMHKLRSKHQSPPTKRTDVDQP